jgi:ubiquinone/menaquinone biosynthesis C-methylase UbiE
MLKEWTGERLEPFVYNDITIEHLHRYAFAKEFIKNKVVLDIACGEGYGSNLLSSEADSVTGVDIDTRTIIHAAKKYRRKNLRFLQGDVEKIPCDTHRIDVTISFETLEHTNDHVKMLEEIKRVLKPEGILIISTPEKKTYKDAPGSELNPFHIKELYEKEFTDLLSRFFKYHVQLNQDSFLSSLIVHPNASETRIYRGDYADIQEVISITPRYIIAVCSDREISALPSSIFISRDILEIILREKAESVKRSFSYKIGHMILLPAKTIHKMFAKRKKDIDA